MDVGIYTIYPMVVLFGEPKGLTAKATTCEVPTTNGPKPIDLQGNVIFEYKGMSAEVMYSKIADSLLRTEISCDAGIISLDQIHYLPGSDSYHSGRYVYEERGAHFWAVWNAGGRGHNSAT